MNGFILVMMIGSFLTAHPVWAEMYRYKDAAGVVRYSDNLADVPEKQRTRIVYENTSSPAATSVPEQPSGLDTLSGQNLEKVPEKPLSGEPSADSPLSEDASNDPSRIDQLLKIKTALDAENAQFMKESLALSEEKKTLAGNAAIKAFNEKISALNSRVEDYEKRRAVFQKEADAFDAALKKRLAPPPQPPKSSPP